MSPSLARSPTTMAISLVATTAILISRVVLANDEFKWPDEIKGAPPIQYSTLSGPSFLNTSSSNTVSAVAGTTAKLPCGIKNLHNYTVSWVRGRDIRLLTTGSTTYTSDKRFVAINPSGGQQWILKIHYVRKDDAGSYLCQVSITPPITLIVNLTVQEAVATVLPGPEVYVQSGSRLEVVCQVEGCPPPALLSWRREGQPVLTPESNTYDLAHDNGSTPIARLTLAHPHAAPSHSGSYSCTSTCTAPVNVTVHVLRGEELAEYMQHHNTAAPRALACSLLPSLIAAAATMLLHWCWPGRSLLLLPPPPRPQPRSPVLCRTSPLLSRSLLRT
ncbi:hemicentin-1-like [Panulirus ornatus]|uniref:hemicentin-1-like n=1 Tax=Panulirus ornatus TaxID=150431 RepID=UPI003A86AE1C